MHRRLQSCFLLLLLSEARSGGFNPVWADEAEAQLIIYPFRDEMEEHAAAGPGVPLAPPPPARPRGRCRNEIQIESFICEKPSLLLMIPQLGALRGQRSNTVNVSEVSHEPITPTNVSIILQKQNFSPRRSHSTSQQAQPSAQSA